MEFPFHDITKAQARYMQLKEAIGRYKWLFKNYDQRILLTLVTTDKCTLRCDHCFEEAGPEKNTFLDAKIVDGIAKESEEIFGNYKTALIRITGGDAFLHPQLNSIIGSFTRRRDSLGYDFLDVETNGWWATDDEMAWSYIIDMKKLGIDMLSMTIDYFHCKQGIFDIDDHYDRINKISREENVPFRNINTGFGFWDGEAEEKLEEHRKTCKKCGPGGLLVSPVGRARDLPECYWGGLHTCIAEGCRLVPPTFMGFYGTPFHTEEVTIKQDGNVYLCNSGRDFENVSLSVGNVYDNSLTDILENPDNKIVSMIKKGGLRTLSKRAGIPIDEHWKLYGKMTPCGMCHEMLREYGKEISERL